MADTKLCGCGCGQVPPLATRTRPDVGHVKGQPVNYLVGHHRKGRKLPVLAEVKGYRIVDKDFLHRLRAEEALGKPLPPRAVVHHADGSKSDRAPLVICEDSRYHMLLHVRTRIVRAGGDPDCQSVCSGCKRVLDHSEFNKKRCQVSFGLQARCRRCQSEYHAKRTQKWKREHAHAS